MAEQSIKDRYLALLMAYISKADEKRLLAAEDLGRELVQANIPPEEVAEIHADALRQLPREFPDLSLWDAIEPTSAVLMEMFMAYGLAFRRRREERERAKQALRETEEQLRQSRKLEAVGRLAGGMAHDFNNLLTIITGYAELALKNLSKDDPLRKDIEGMERAGEGAASLIAQLLAFSRRQVLQPKVVDLNDLVVETGRMLRPLIGEDIELSTKLGTDLGRVEVDPGQIQQVIVNLAVNSRDAMPRGGKLDVETQNVDLDQAYEHQRTTMEPGSYVMLTVSDTGTGMDEETQARIFDPFFTTKEQGKGTGLGLSTVYGIVKQSGGHVWCYSEPGKGTTFKIYLPRIEGKKYPHKTDVIPAAPRKGTETILLVEDEEAVRMVARRVLQAYDYTALETQDPNDALRVCEEHDGPISLVLTDVVMPGMGGRELAGRLVRLRPEMRVLYMSGYTEEAIATHGVMDPGAAFIQKPFSPDDLARKVREVLDAPREETR